MRLVTLALFALIALSINADTFYVDGPGDGNGDGIDDYETIRDALIALGPAGSDGVSDEIGVVVDDLYEPIGFTVNGTSVSVEPYWPLTDSLTFDGDADGNLVRCTYGTGPENDLLGELNRIVFRLASHQSITFENFHAYHSEDTLGDEDTYGSFISLTPGTNPVLGSSLNVRNCLFEGAVGHRLYGGSSAVIRMRDFSSESETSIQIAECVFENNWGKSIDLHMGGGSVTIIDSVFTGNGRRYWGYPDPHGLFPGTPLDIWAGGSVSLSLSDVAMWGNIWCNAIEFTGTEDPISMEIGPGCFIGSHWWDQISLSSGTGGADVNIEGTPDDPVILTDGGEVGIELYLQGDSRVRVNDLIVWNTSEAALEISGSNLEEGFFAVFDQCLFAENAEVDTREFMGNISRFAPHSIDISGRGAAPLSFEFTNCTFHDVVSDYHVLDDNQNPLYLPTLIRFGSYLNANNIIAEFTNCIFSGSEIEDAFEIAHPEVDPGIIQVDLDHCAVVLDGLTGIHSLTISGEAFINQNSVIFGDPHYLNVNTPPDENSFDVNSPFFGHAGPGGGPLTGWGDYVGTPYDGGGAGLELH